MCAIGGELAARLAYVGQPEEKEPGNCRAAAAGGGGRLLPPEYRNNGHRPRLPRAATPPRASHTRGRAGSEEEGVVLLFLPYYR